MTEVVRQATRDRYAIRGYISTAAKHGAHIPAAIHDALAGNPWLPPIPTRRKPRRTAPAHQSSAPGT
jgi:hypothetical protein